MPPPILVFILCGDEFVLTLARSPPVTSNLQRPDLPETNRWCHSTGRSIWSLPVPAAHPGEFLSSRQRAHGLSTVAGSGLRRIFWSPPTDADVALGEPLISHPTTAYPFILFITLTGGPAVRFKPRPRALMECATPVGKAYP